MSTGTPSISRRKFIRSGALLSGGLLLSFNIPVANKLAALAGIGAEEPFAPNAYLHIAPDNTVTVILSHVEMGQGIWTTLAMLVADELDADLKAIRVMHSGVDKAYNHTAYGIMITGGSTSTWSEFDRYRKAGAAARIMLTQVAATRAGVAVADCRTENGHVIAGGKRFSYGELATDASLLSAPAIIPLRSPSEWKYIGKGANRLDAPAKTNGTAKFGIDVQAEGLLTAVVVHPPVFGAKVRSYDSSKALAVKGVREVVQIPGGVAVIADHYWAADNGRKVLQVSWDEGPGASLNTTTQTTMYRQLAKTDGLPAQKKGDAAAALGKASRTIEAEYTFPYLAHTPMEPLNVTVKVDANGCEIWTGTQLPGLDQAAAARILGLQPEQVKMNIVFLGGGFGRRATPTSDFVSEAAHIVKASRHKFIKMVWSREDDIKGGYYRPFYVHHVQVATGDDGMPLAWRHNIVGQSILGDSPFSSMIRDGIDETSVEGVKESPYLTAVPDHFVGLHTTKEVVPVLWYRSVGNTHTAYVMECIIDELAHAAGKDPVSYRRGLFKDHPRHLAALNLVAEKAGWETAPTAGRYKGVAIHESFGSYVAIIAEVSVQDEKVRVHKVDCAIDCGLAVNPDGVRAQMESGIVFGLTMALYGELTFEGGRLLQHNFYDYRIARMNESPEINVYIVDSNEKMGGAGECGVPPTAPAIANAIFKATGRRIYDLPFMNIPLKEKA